MDYLEQNLLPSNDKVARRLILESQDYVMTNGVLYHLSQVGKIGQTAGCSIRSAERYPVVIP